MITRNDFEERKEFYLTTNSETIKLTCNKTRKDFETESDKLSIFEERYIGKIVYRSNSIVRQILEIKENGILMSSSVFGYDSDFIKFEDCILRDTVKELKAIKERNKLLEIERKKQTKK